MIFSKALKTTKKGCGIVIAINEFFEENKLLWEQIRIFTDGAPVMLGSRSEFLKLPKENICYNRKIVSFTDIL